MLTRIRNETVVPGLVLMHSSNKLMNIRRGDGMVMEIWEGNEGGRVSKVEDWEIDW